MLLRGQGSQFRVEFFSENVDFTESLRQNSGSKITLFLECANLNAIIQIISRISQRDMEISIIYEFKIPIQIA